MRKMGLKHGMRNVDRDDFKYARVSAEEKSEQGGGPCLISRHLGGLDFGLGS